MSRIATCEPAYSVVHRLGGDLRVARELGIKRDAVWRWHAPKERKGQGGVIPRRRHPQLLELAKMVGVELTARDLLIGAADRPR